MDEYKKYEPIFGSWYLSRMIGKGSFGKVFEITREEFGTTYRSALKIITIPQDDDDLKTRMTEGTDVETVSEYYEGILKEIINENEIMSQLKGNSNIVSYEDHQIIPHGDGIGYDILIRMELLTPLLDRMVEKRLDEKEVVKLGIDMCRALELCHKKNIIHRDIKPQNIFISDNGDFKLGDFGIARTMEKTTGGMSKKGTYKYMAPEVFRGDHYDSTVDIYSLGIVLYSLLNGNRGPFLPPPPAKVTHNDEEEARMRRFRGEPIPAPRDASPMLAYIIQKACSAYPGQRYHTAEQMRRDLESYLQNYGQAAAIMGETASEKTVLDESIRAYTGSYNAGQLRQTGSYYPPQGSGQYPPQPTQPVSSGGNGSSKKIIAIAAAAILLVVIIGVVTAVYILKESNDNDVSAEVSEEVETEITETVESEDENTKEAMAHDVAVQRIIAHRGTGGFYDSFESYDSAVDQGAKYIEQDVKLLDGDLYVAYEDDSSYNKVKLRDVFERYGKDVTYVVEIKSRDIYTEEAFIKLVSDYSYQDNVILQCFEGWMLKDVKKAFPEMKTMYLCNNSHGGQAAFEEALGWGYVDILAVSYDEGMMTRSNCRLAHDAGKEFSAWILDQDSSIIEAIDMDVDIYFTRMPARAIELEEKYRQ